MIFPGPGTVSDVVRLLLVPLQWLHKVCLVMSGQGLDMPLGVELAILVAIVILVLALQGALRREKRLARTDPLTGLANRRRFYEQATFEFAHAQRSGRPCTIAYMDLDNFKYVNDHHGHVAGDRLLKLIARSLLRTLRPTDCVARLGGDEFVILLPETGPDAARDALKHVSLEVQKTLKHSRWSITSSVGAVSYLDAPSSVDDALQYVDATMYQVKKNGKNSIRMSVWRRRASLPELETSSPQRSGEFVLVPVQI